ncbi:hypothetical protein DFJ74DRAFT_741638 [Hyaloraphidium curvatum]|nr:hypothetical protein DFJ74DRAFT_741638 [Hyaloraphidium curvatum]
MPASSPRRRASPRRPRPRSRSPGRIFPVATLRIPLRAVCGYLLLPGPRLLTVLSASSGRVGVPGGFVDRRDRCPFAALEREWREEVGTRLPECEVLARFVAPEDRGETGVYLLRLAPRADPAEVRFDGERSDGEMRGIALRTLEEMREGVEGRAGWRMRGCAVESTRVVLDWLEERGWR